MTNDEINDGAAALEAYAEGQSWKAHFAPAKAWHEGSIDIIKAADGSADKSPAGQVVAAIAALHVALKAIDQETALNAQQYHDAAAVVLAAVNKRRIRTMLVTTPKPGVRVPQGGPPKPPAA